MKEVLLLFQILVNLLFFWILLPLIKFSPGEQKETKWPDEEDEIARRKSTDNQVNIPQLNNTLYKQNSPPIRVWVTDFIGYLLCKYLS